MKLIFVFLEEARKLSFPSATAIIGQEKNVTSFTVNISTKAYGEHFTIDPCNSLGASEAAIM